MKILIVEDDENIVRVISDNLTKWGYDVLAVENFNDVMETFNNFKPQLVLLDIVLPFFNGYYWSSEIRKISTVPIIFISSKAEDGDIVMGMQFGGDDYITKPLNMDVLNAKIQAVLRRSYNFVNEIEYLEFKDVQLYLSESRIEHCEKNADLTKTELLIMDSLFRKQGGIAKREEIMDKCEPERGGGEGGGRPGGKQILKFHNFKHIKGYQYNQNSKKNIFRRIRRFCRTTSSRP